LTDDLQSVTRDMGKERDRRNECARHAPIGRQVKRIPARDVGRFDPIAQERKLALEINGHALWHGGAPLRQLRFDNSAAALRLWNFLLTENQPTIKPYNQGDWAETPETRGPAEVSLALLEALHRRWVLLLGALRPEDFARTLNHPENGIMTLDGIVAMYAWHGRHHTAHITGLR
jgi:hypothetical protein